jgi:very-short-patch-repair endonuclease
MSFRKGTISAETIEKMRKAKLGTHPVVSQIEKERRRKKCLEYNVSDIGRENSRKNITKCINTAGIHKKPKTEDHKRKIKEGQKCRNPRQFWKGNIAEIENRRIQESIKWCKSEEGRKSSSVTSKERWDKLTKDERRNILKPAIISSFNGNKRFFNTKPEKEMKRCLNELGIKYEFQYPVEDIKHCYKADFYLPLYNIILEVDGIWSHNYPDGTELDNIRINELEDAGYRVLRFWENEFDAKSVWREI